jgi:HNH endonuclease
MEIDLPLVKHILQALGGKASCSEIAGMLHQKYSKKQYSEVDLAVRRIVYTYCPQHVENYAGEPVFEALDVWYYGFWKPSKQYTKRYSQTLYRQKLMNSWRHCMVTGVKVSCKASHIKPCRQCEVQEEKVNVFNGLLLSPTLDELFDKGMISFNDEGQILFSPKLNSHDVQRLGLSPEMKLQIVQSGNRYFLQHHRCHVFLVNR